MRSTPSRCKISRMSEILDIVNDNDEVIGQAERDRVHREGLVCRLVYVCFYAANGEVILQKRSDTKKNDPGKLTTTVSGHVASGQTYVEAAVRETLEESGVEITSENLHNLGVVRADYVQGDYLSNAMRGLFAYRFDGNVSDLKVEDGEGAGFEVFNIDDLEKKLESNPERFAVVLADEVGKSLVRKVRALIEIQ